MLLLLLSRFSRVQLCATPQTAAHQAPPSLGFSRQEHWSGLPFPSPVHESESESEVAQLRPHGLQPTRLLHPWDFPGRSAGVGCHRLLRNAPELMINRRSGLGVALTGCTSCRWTPVAANHRPSFVQSQSSLTASSPIWHLHLSSPE